jgi:hypothetical protein
VDYSLINFLRPHITTSALPLQDDIRDIYRDVQEGRERRHVDYREPSEVVSLMLAASEFKPCSLHFPQRLGPTVVKPVMDSWMADYGHAEFAIFTRI